MKIILLIIAFNLFLLGCDKQIITNTGDPITIELNDGISKQNEIFEFVISLNSDQTFKFEIGDDKKYLNIAKSDIRIKNDENCYLTADRYRCSVVLDKETTNIKLFFTDSKGNEVVKDIIIKALPNKFDIISPANIEENVLVNTPITYKFRLLKSISTISHSFKYSFTTGSGKLNFENKFYNENEVININKMDNFIDIISMSIGKNEIKLTFYDEYGNIVEKNVSFMAIDQSANLAICNMFIENNKSLPSNISFNILKKDYNGKVSLKCELIKGNGIVKFGVDNILSTEEIPVNTGNIQLEYTPNEPIPTELKITIKLPDGETVSKNISIDIEKTDVEISYGDGNGISFYVSDKSWYNSNNKTYTLPTNFGSSISLMLSRSWKGQYNRAIAGNKIEVGTTMELKCYSGGISNWSGISSELIDNEIASYGFSINLEKKHNPFFDFIVLN